MTIGVSLDARGPIQPQTFSSIRATTFGALGGIIPAGMAATAAASSWALSSRSAGQALLKPGNVIEDVAGDPLRLAD